MSAFRPFRRADYGFTPAKIAKVAKDGRSEPRTLASLAALAGQEAENGVSQAPT